MSIRNIDRIVTPQAVTEGAGVHLKRSIATQELNYVDPFLLFDHFKSDNPEDYLAGFPMHPHRGIETVTYMLAGNVNHKDTLGNSGTIGPGDVQWMTSGRGILHEEMPKPKDGMMDGFQLWVNLPARLKMTDPGYQEINALKIPVVKHSDGTTIRVISGTVDDVSGAVTAIAADPVYLDVELPPDTVFKHNIPADHNVITYLYDGMIIQDEQTISSPKMIVFSDGDEVQLTSDANGAKFLLMAGKPFNEPIARYGPFVMNTREEIQQTLEDLRSGNFIR